VCTENFQEHSRMFTGIDTFKRTFMALNYFPLSAGLCTSILFVNHSVCACMGETSDQEIKYIFLYVSVLNVVAYLLFLCSLLGKKSILFLPRHTDPSKVGMSIKLIGPIFFITILKLVAQVTR